MCQLYVKVCQMLVDQMMNSFCRPMLEHIVNTAIKIEFSVGEQAVTFGRWHLLYDFFLHLDKERLLS